MRLNLESSITIVQLEILKTHPILSLKGGGI